ncbi:uncharacterized protein LOC111706339 isoform X2 [Eurytemora carolleeae]|uniref:uncharacterized protein LOC111706339 isoform X2 n=1 Tax=Eurytemora carolleeae TaxID=1294199 RepID=UPI000C7674F1|nr:uncharacterized protein LOC111706339 isoform X2 [Eurytemora carolleeae]|eukprot:XP_023334957.1 uncharacterized protein LOC111706339 isoform X2 [Eurytemora affinis]
MNEELREHSTVIWNINKQVLLQAENDPQGPGGPAPLPSSEGTNHAPIRPTRSKHSPPSSRPSSQYNHQLKGLGSVDEAWQNREKWAEFRLYLAAIEEGRDSEDRPILADRYAIFVELYADLDAAERNDEPVSSRLNLFKQITQHDEQFFGRERCLKCLDSGKRGEVLKGIKGVNSGGAPPSTQVFIHVYPRVVDRLSELLGNYQNSLIEKTNQAENR